MDFKAKSEEIVAVGEANRGMQVPEGAPARMYNYWLDRTDSDKGRKIRNGARRENFCHYWRVVMFWGPLMWLGKKMEAVADAKYTPIVFGLTVLAAVLSITLWGGGLMGLLALAGAVVAAAVGMGLIFVLLNYLEGHPKAASVIGRTLLGVAALGALAFFLYLTGLVGVGILIAGATVAVLVRMNIERLSDWIEARRAKARAADAERARERERRNNEFYNEHGYWPWSSEAKKAPGRVSKFFTGVGDFIVMLANVVRVNKWKICPIMDVNGDATRGDVDYA